MIPRISLFIILVVTGFLVSAQVFVYEDFSEGQMPPAGWSISGVPQQWSISWSSLSSGGIPSKIPEAKFSFIDTIATTRLVSPVFDLTGLTSVKFHFRFYYQFNQSPAPIAEVSTRTKGGQWNRIWHLNPSANNGPKDIDLTITNSDVGSNRFQFSFSLEGNLNNISYWYLDDIALIDPLTNDGNLTTIDSTETFISTPSPVKGTVYNMGSDTIHSAVIDWQINNGTVHSTAINNLNVPPLLSFNFTCTDLMDPPIGVNNLVVWIREINGAPDADPSNDTLSTQVQMVCLHVARKPLFEEFTSSTCFICPAFDDLFRPWCASHENAITLVKYQMYWPSPGDPYCTAEGRVRKRYYNVGGVPRAYCDGDWIFGNTNTVGVQEAFDREIRKSGMMKIVSTHTLTGHVMAVNTTVLPFANFSGLKLYVAVIEKVTYNNASPYSTATSFEHVMMKMMPDAQGTKLKLVDREPFTYTDTVDLTGTHVERWDDLMVAAWVQDSLAKKLVYQSCYSLENGVLGTEARLSNILVNDVGIPDFNPDSFHYNVVESGVGSGETYIVKGIPIDRNETVIVIPTQVFPGTTTIDVFAQNYVDHNQYTVEFSQTGGIQDTPVKTVTVFPNPATEKVFIYGADHAMITLYTSTGICMQKLENFTGTVLSLNGLHKGIYIMKIMRKDGGVIQKKIIVQ